MIDLDRQHERMIERRRVNVAFCRNCDAEMTDYEPLHCELCNGQGCAECLTEDNQLGGWLCDSCIERAAERTAGLLIQGVTDALQNLDHNHYYAGKCIDENGGVLLEFESSTAPAVKVRVAAMGA